ncbi:MAG TPA: AmmeMemoRadiSam system protein A [Acidimicrobiia bacterium]|jgi:hypothetical protein
MTSGPALDDHRRSALLDVAARAIGNALVTGRVALLGDDEIDDPVLGEPGAVFVTLLRDERLLGCVGSLHPVESLAHAVHRAALQAAFADPRLPAVTPADFEAMTIKISVLSALEEIAVASYRELLAEARPGVDGLVIEAGAHRATLLPSVWEQCGDANQFLDALWAKAGLAAFAWPRGLSAERYTTEEFASYGPRALTTA